MVSPQANIRRQSAGAGGQALSVLTPPATAEAVGYSPEKPNAAGKFEQRSCLVDRGIIRPSRGAPPLEPDALFLPAVQGSTPASNSAIRVMNPLRAITWSIPADRARLMVAVSTWETKPTT